MSVCYCAIRHFILATELMFSGDSTLTTLWENSADDIWLYFSYFISQKTGFDIACQWSPVETRCMKCQNLFSEKKKKKKKKKKTISICRLLNFLPRMLDANGAGCKLYPNVFEFMQLFIFLSALTLKAPITCSRRLCFFFFFFRDKQTIHMKCQDLSYLKKKTNKKKQKKKKKKQ